VSWRYSSCCNASTASGSGNGGVGEDAGDVQEGRAPQVSAEGAQLLVGMVDAVGGAPAADLAAHVGGDGQLEGGGGELGGGGGGEQRGRQARRQEPHVEDEEDHGGDGDEGGEAHRDVDQRADDGIAAGGAIGGGQGGGRQAGPLAELIGVMGVFLWLRAGLSAAA
jgi:hypothetical protein